MAAAGIITEYNPLHMGHVHLMAEARRLLGPETGILCVMSGNYVQRGAFALADKAARAAAAAEEMRRDYLLGCVGRTFDVLYEQRLDGRYQGHAPNYAAVAAPGDGLRNRVVPTRITGVENGLLLGELCALPET